MAAYPDNTSRTKTKSHQTSELKTSRSRHHGTRKNITFPTDAKLYNKTRQQLTQVTKEQNITLRQTYDKACNKLMPKMGLYGQAKQYKRMRKAIKQVKGFLG